MHVDCAWPWLGTPVSTHVGFTPQAKSAIYDCLVIISPLYPALCPLLLPYVRILAPPMVQYLLTSSLPCHSQHFGRS